MRNRSHSLVGIGVGLALLVASCGGSAVDYEYQALDEFMGWDDFDTRAAEEAWEAIDLQIEEEITECMTDRGLGYTPYPVGAGRPNPYEGLTDNEAKLRYGYVFGGMLHDHLWAVEHPDEGQDPDTMWGEHTDGIDMDTYIAAVDECSEQAEKVLRGQPEADDLYRSLEEAWAPLDSDRQRLEEDLEIALTSDTRVVEAEADWSACMAEEGYDFETEGAIFDYLLPMLDDIDERGGMTIPLREDVFSEEELKELVDIELAIAAADVACRSDLDRVFEEIRAEYEGEFIAEHSEQLEKIRVLEQQLMERMLQGGD